jgi:hypothetical protein
MPLPPKTFCLPLFLSARSKYTFPFTKKIELFQSLMQPKLKIQLLAK